MILHHQIKKLLIVWFLLFLPLPLYALDVVPGLKGFGVDTRAAYGNGVNPTICIVDDLDEEAAMAEETRNGVTVLTGGLRQFVENVTNINTTFCSAANDPFDCCTGNTTGTCEDNKLIIFETSGVIEDFAEWTLDDDYITLAFQTAPSPGISIHGVQFTISGNHILFQHARIRAGDNVAGAGGDSRNAVEWFGSYGVFDHSTFSWAPDTNFGSSQASNWTISNSIISEGLDYSIHTKATTAGHSTGLNLTNTQSYVSVINNLMAHNRYRNPNSSGNTYPQHMLISNNIAYNFETKNFEISESTGVQNYDFVNNISTRGLESTGGVKIPYGFDQTQNANSVFYVDGNRICTSYQAGCNTQDDSVDWDTVICPGDTDCTTTIANNRSATVAFAYPAGYTPMAVGDVEAYVLANVGARPSDRDEVDARVIASVSADTGRWIDTIEYTDADCVDVDEGPGAIFLGCCSGSGTGTCRQNTEGGWPTLAVNTGTHNNLPADPHGDNDADGYTDLEEFIHNYSKLVEGDSINAQNVIPPDNATDVNVDASATWYNSPLVTSVDLWLDEGVCDGTPLDAGADNQGDELDDATVETYDMSTLKVQTPYCLTIMANFTGGPGNQVQYDFTTSEGPPAVSASKSSIIHSSGGGSIVHDDSGATAE